MRELGAYIGNIQHFNMHDGTGLRTTIFFQGCTLRCAWCQNPELMSREPVMMYNRYRCVHCNACVKSCNRALLPACDILPTNQGEICDSCRSCVEECYFQARTFSSQWMTLDEVFRESMQDEPFYAGGGGITLSGGEPLLNIEFSKSLAKMLNKAGQNVIVETSGFVPYENILKIAPYVSIFYYDLKLINVNLRFKYLGTRDSLMLDNLQRLAKTQAKIVLRVPVIPHINDTVEEFNNILNFATKLKHVSEIHILPYHTLSIGKYEMIGKKYQLENWPEINKERIEMMSKIACDRGFYVNVGGI